jgi:hypothetical protein
MNIVGAGKGCPKKARASRTTHVRSLCLAAAMRRRYLALLIACAAEERRWCPTAFAAGRRVRLAAFLVSLRGNTGARDAIRRTWCGTAREINAHSAAATVQVRFFVGVGARQSDDDGAAPDVVTDGEPDAANSRRWFRALATAAGWAAAATHFLSLDDDAYPFLDRIVADLAAGRALSNPVAASAARPVETPLAPPFVWGYFMVHGAFGPWPFPVGYGKVLSADVAALLAAQGERVPLEHATDCLATNLTQGQCVKGTYVMADNHLGLLLAPYAYQRVHDRRFHVAFASVASPRQDATPGRPVSAESRLVDRHDLKYDMPSIAEFLDAVHAAAGSGNYDAVNVGAGGPCAQERVHCFAGGFDYSFDVDHLNLRLRFEDCPAATTWGATMCRPGPSGKVAFVHARDGPVVDVYVEDCLTIGADIAGIARGALSGCAEGA